MIRRINAFRIVFNLLLSVVELLIGVRFLIEIFGSSQSLDDLIRVVGATLGQMTGFSEEFLSQSGMAGPVASLVLVLGFMLFSLTLIMFVPGMARKRERELEFIDD